MATPLQGATNMPSNKKERPDQTPPPARDHAIECASCQRKLDPHKDDITFLGMGKWRDGPGLFHPVCSAKTPDNEDNPCLQNGLAWAKKFTSQEPVLFTYEQWKARPVRRRVSATRAANTSIKPLLPHDVRCLASRSDYSLAMKFVHMYIQI